MQWGQRWRWWLWQWGHWSCLVTRVSFGKGGEERVYHLAVLQPCDPSVAGIGELVLILVLVKLMLNMMAMLAASLSRRCLLASKTESVGDGDSWWQLMLIDGRDS
jgi:hypothetical protein